MTGSPICEAKIRDSDAVLKDFLRAAEQCLLKSPSWDCVGAHRTGRLYLPRFEPRTYAPRSIIYPMQGYVRLHVQCAYLVSCDVLLIYMLLAMQFQVCCLPSELAASSGQLD